MSSCDSAAAATAAAAPTEPTPSKRRRDTPPTKQAVPRPSRIVKLLVGGREHCTTRATLSLVTGSFLDRLVNQEDEGGMAALDDGRFFIDRDGDIFALVLDYLRTAGVSVPEYDPETLRRLRIDADARFRVSFWYARARAIRSRGSARRRPTRSPPKPTPDPPHARRQLQRPRALKPPTS